MDLFFSSKLFFFCIYIFRLTGGQSVLLVYYIERQIIYYCRYIRLLCTERLSVQFIYERRMRYAYRKYCLWINNIGW
jgi:hypothetical protein